MIRIYFLSFFLAFSFVLGGCSEQNISSHAISFQTFQEKVAKKEAMVLEIGSSSCRSCIEMKKTIEKLKARTPSLPIYILDVYDDFTIFSYFKLQVIPTQIVIDKKGNEIYRHSGILKEAELLKLVMTLDAL
ncbi:MAG: thioredoxin family protein [Thiovulaceae bacterium]|jgi:thioredoxin 1|nr:thioredoxin family protein [Sulfurimonadaceae bacterium]